MRKFDPLDEPTADKSAIKCFDCPYLTEMARLESQSVVRVEEISKKRTTKQYIQNLWRVHPRERWQTTLYRAAKKRFDCTKIWSRRIRHFLNLGTVFFSTQIRADGALRVVWRVVSKRCYFGELNQFRAVKNKHLRLQKYPDSWTGPKAHGRDGRLPAVPRDYRAGVHVKCDWTRQTREGEDWKDRWVRLFLLSLYQFSSRLVAVSSPA